MADSAPDIGPRLQAERKRKNLTLTQLAERSRVSKSMLSQIERGQANPTFGTLWNLTRALDTPLSALVGEQVKGVEAGPALEHVKAHATPAMTSADALCTLRILSPPELAGVTEWYDLTIEPGGVLESEPHAVGAMEHLTSLEGRFALESGGQRLEIDAADTARYAADVPHSIANLGKTRARALLIVLS